MTRFALINAAKAEGEGPARHIRIGDSGNQWTAARRNIDGSEQVQYLIFDVECIRSPHRNDVEVLVEFMEHMQSVEEREKRTRGIPPWLLDSVGRRFTSV